MTHQPIRSFIQRDGRITKSQKKALEILWPTVGLPLQKSFYDLPKLFERNAPIILEIGFGSGLSLLAMAKENLDKNFIGIETYKPGVGSLILGIQLCELKNIKIFHADAYEVLEQCIPNESIDAVQIFFPDPWPKRKHHKRRLIQQKFIDLLISKIKNSGCIHLATDWEDYALSMMKVLSATPQLENMAGALNFATRSLNRPVITKFEKRGKEQGFSIWELQFRKICSV